MVKQLVLSLSMLILFMNSGISKETGNDLNSSSTATDDRIRPYDGNPFYWQYKGKPLILIGGSDDDNLFQWEESALAGHLDLLQLQGGNYIRNTMSSRDAGNEDPFLRLENGLYDLDRWNPVYWNKFENLLKSTYERDIIVQIELWDPHDWYYGTDGPGIEYGWKDRSFNPLNNINYTARESGLLTMIDFNAVRERARDHTFFHTVNPEKDMSVVLHYQELFVGRVIELSLSYPNVLYCISNESANHIEWSLHWLNFIRKMAAGANIPVMVGEMLVYPTSSLVTEYGFDFAELSQSASGLHRPSGSNIGEGHFETIASEVKRLEDNPSPLNSVKQYGGELSWTRGPEEGVDRFWRTVFGGQATVRFHRPPGGIGLDERAQANIRSMRMITDEFDLKEVRPHQKLAHLFLERDADEAYLIAEESKVYALFFTSAGRQVELDISAFKGRVLVRWLDPNMAVWSEPQLLTGNSVVLTKPASGQWVALIKH